MAEEEVVMENSPLQKYLDEIGFTDFERVSSAEGHEKRTEGKLSFLWAKMKGPFRNNIFTWESFFVWTPPRHYLEAFRKDYIAAVADSGMLNDDDLRFLDNFDPELLKPGKPCTLSEPQKEVNFFISNCVSRIGRRGLLTFFVLLVSALLATCNELAFLVFSVSMITFCVVGIKTLSRCYFNICHRTNIGQLKSFISYTKQLALLLKKSLKLLQEMELLSRGYTMVGPIVPAFLEDNENLASWVYPALRKAVLKNAENVTSCLRRSTKELLFYFPLNLELAGIFTYLSTGCKEIKPNYCAEELSLQTLKLMTSLVCNMQSEFLSRFLLCLSLEANGGNLTQLYTNLFTNLKKIFGSHSKLLAESLASIERSYNMHKRCCLTSNELSVKHPTRSHNKWTGLDVALHSLQLHLQVGMLRVQCLQQVLSKTETEKEVKSTVTTHINSNLETTFYWLKMDIESALSCWKEGEKSLEKWLGKESPETLENKTSSEMLALEKSTGSCACDLNEEPVEIDRVYEAFSDPSDENFYKHPTLTAEDLERDNNIVKDNKQLLQELKAVLITKTKDPLISTAGYVQPVKSPVTIQRDTSDRPHKEVIASFNPKEIVKGVNSQSWSDKLCFHEQFSKPEASQLPMPFTNLQSSVAVSVAAAAATRSKAMGLSEEHFISDDESD